MREASVSTLPPPPPRMSEQSSTMSLASSSNALASASAGDPPKMPPTANLVSTGPKYDPRWDLLTESPSPIQSSDAAASDDAWVTTGSTVEPTPAATPCNWSVDPATGMYQPSSLTIPEQPARSSRHWKMATMGKHARQVMGSNSRQRSTVFNVRRRIAIRVSTAAKTRYNRSTTTATSQVQTTNASSAVFSG